MKSLSADIQSMEAAKDHAFTPPPRAWITARIGKLNHLLATRTEKSALALRRLTGAITLSPQKPEVGRPYYMAANSMPSTCWLRTEGRIYCIGGGTGSPSVRHRSPLDITVPMPCGAGVRFPALSRKQ